MTPPVGPERSLAAKPTVTKWHVDYQRLLKGQDRPFDQSEHHQEFSSPPLLPEVGDSVYFEGHPEHRAFKVVTRHFSFLGDACFVNIVVTEMAAGEMGARLKM